VTFVEIVWWTAFAAGVCDGMGLSHGGLIALAVVPLVVLLIRAEDYVLEPRRARNPQNECAEPLSARRRTTLVHQDDFGRLWEDGSDGSGEPIRIVEVVNATPDEDGSSRHYFLRVPPSVGTAQEAVAWTFGLGASEYVPVRES
jgi:hypothetical protein